MPKAIWNDAVVAESGETVVLEGNHYFPASSLKREFFRAADRSTVCFWKGEASYYDIEVGGEVNRGAAWYYADPKERAAHIKDHVAFWGGVRVEE
jgi:uncharacterized protein (DUF427 family)